MLFCNRIGRPEQELLNAFLNLELEPYQKHALQARYIDNLVECIQRANKFSKYFNGGRILVTVGSLMVPGLLSVQYIKNSQWIDSETFQVQVYWITWALSLIVTISNGLITLFKLDKKYYFIHTTKELLMSEGWQYIALTGRYATKEAGPTATHYNQFVVFYHNAEKIKLRQVEEEYYKFTDLPTTTQQANGQKPSQTPSQQQQIPQQPKSLLDGWLGDMKVMSKKVAPQFPQRSSPQDILHLGLQKRRDSQASVDGGPGPTEVSQVQRTSTEGSVSMQSDVQEAAAAGPTVVQPPHMPPIPENEIVQILPSESDERLRAAAGYGIVESEGRAT
jgi:hypothetical protein